MDNIVKYKIITGTIREIEEAMVKAIAEGWSPFGSMCAYPDNFDEFCQPIVMYDYNYEELEKSFDEFEKNL